MKRALLLVVPLLLAGCGGDDADPKAEFVAKAEAICSDAKAERDKNPQPSSPAGFAGYVEKLVAIAEKAHHELSALELPEDDEATLKAKLLDPLGADVAAGKAYAAQVKAAGSDGAKLLRLLGTRPRPTVDLEFAKSYGLPTCAAGAS